MVQKLLTYPLYFLQRVQKTDFDVEHQVISRAPCHAMSPLLFSRDKAGRKLLCRLKQKESFHRIIESKNHEGWIRPTGSPSPTIHSPFTNVQPFPCQ